MRVIAGTQKGRRLLGPTRAGLRPTSDRVKEALFAILGPRIVGARFLDLYAGTGAVGIEAMSRGAQQVTFVEPNPDSLRVLRANLDRCGLLPVADIHACSAEVFLRRRASQGSTHDVVFADPPYRTDSGRSLLPLLGLGAIITCDSIVVLEHFTKLVVPPQVGHLTRLRQYRYGDTTLSVFGVNGEGADSP